MPRLNVPTYKNATYTVPIFSKICFYNITKGICYLCTIIGEFMIMKLICRFQLITIDEMFYIFIVAVSTCVIKYFFGKSVEHIFNNIQGNSLIQEQIRRKNNNANVFDIICSSQI